MIEQGSLPSPEPQSKSDLIRSGCSLFRKVPACSFFHEFGIGSVADPAALLQLQGVTGAMWYWSIISFSVNALHTAFAGFAINMVQ